MALEDAIQANAETDKPMEILGELKLAIADYSNRKGTTP